MNQAAPDKTVIEFASVSKAYRARQGNKTVLDSVDFVLRPGTSLGICGHNGAGKSTLLRLAAGVEQPSAGHVTRNASVSWPIGYASAFQSSLTGTDNVRFIARIYGRPLNQTVEFVKNFSELGEYMAMPIRTYSSGMVARLAFAASLAIEFDCYLIDEITSAGDARFREKSHEALMERKERGSLLMASHDPHMLREFCERGAVLDGGKLTVFDTIDEAIKRHFGPGY